MLTALLSDQDGLVRRTAAEALGKIGAPDAERPLVDALHDPDPVVRTAAARSLGRLSSLRADAELQLVSLLVDAKDSVREAAAQALGTAGDLSRVASSVTSLLTHPEAAVRQSAAHVLWLADTTTPSVAEGLAKVAQDSDSAVRQWVVAALGESSAPRAGLLLVQRLLHDSSEDVRAEAAYRLRFVGDRVGMAGLETAAERTESGEVARWAQQSLMSIMTVSGDDSGPPPNQPGEPGPSHQSP